MLNSIPEEIKQFCQAQAGDLRNFKPASGGCINNGGRLEAEAGVYFIKWNSALQFPEMFTTEAKGLRLLSEPGCLAIPQVVAVHEGETYSGLMMEFISSESHSKNSWSDLAHGLVCLHKVTRDRFGLDHDNYIGSLPQYNTDEARWVDFFIYCRLQPQVKMAYDDNKISDTDVKKFERLEQILPDVMVEEQPALIHGDLWSGNLMTGLQGNPVLIDPAVAFSHREMEIAYTQLFGGFDSRFYEKYHELFPLESGFLERTDIYNLYPLMVHVNLFGGGYYSQVMQILSRWVS